MKKHIEIKTIEHKGISVCVKVDYDRGIASLVDARPSDGTYPEKHWIFAKRGLEYMNGWLNILEAMTVAVKEVKKDLEWKLAEDKKIRNEMNGKMIDLIQEVEKEFIEHTKRPLPSPAKRAKKGTNKRK